MVDKEVRKSPGRGRVEQMPPFLGFMQRTPNRRHTSQREDSHASRHHHNRPNDNPDKKEKEEVKRFAVTLRDLDEYRETVNTFVKYGALVAKLDPAVRSHTQFIITDEEQISFYHDGNRLDPSASLDEGFKTVWYRVFSGVESTTIRVNLKSDRQGWTVDTAFKDELARDIDAGMTVGELRAKITTKLGIQDANRIVLRANGMRNGLIAGNAWVVRQFREVLCTKITARVSPTQTYLVFKNFDRKYVYHPDNPRPPQPEVGFIKRLIAGLIARVLQNGEGRISLSSGDIKIIYGNRVKRSASQVPWGSDVKFVIPEDVASKFQKEETYLLPATEMCDICNDEKRVTEMPGQVTTTCTHKSNGCKSCLQQWILSSMDTVEWNRIKCPECPQYLKFDDVRKHASPEVFIRYDNLATRAALQGIQNFKWCLAPGCDSGQIHNATCPKFKCHACRHRHCTIHNVVWHKGETCEEYDRRNKQKVKDEKASEKVVKATSKKCPKCNKDVHKYAGCNHITCVCRHEWCYICFAPYERNSVNFLFCNHKLECPERNNGDWQMLNDWARMGAGDLPRRQQHRDQQRQQRQPLVPVPIPVPGRPPPGRPPFIRPDLPPVGVRDVPPFFRRRATDAEAIAPLQEHTGNVEGNPNNNNRDNRPRGPLPPGPNRVPPPAREMPDGPGAFDRAAMQQVFDFLGVTAEEFWRERRNPQPRPNPPEPRLGAPAPPSPPTTLLDEVATFLRPFRVANQRMPAPRAPRFGMPHVHMGDDDE